MPFAMSEARELSREAGGQLADDEIVVKCALPLYKSLRPKILLGVGCEDVLRLSRDSYFNNGLASGPVYAQGPPFATDL